MLSARGCAMLPSIQGDIRPGQTSPPRRRRVGRWLAASAAAAWAACAWLTAGDRSRAGAPLASVPAGLPAAAGANESSGQTVWMPALETELWYKRQVRKRLIRILYQASETQRYINTARHLEEQGPDGSRLVKSGGRDDAEDPRTGGPPPQELFDLLEVEDRIRVLRHLRRITMAKMYASKSARRLAQLRQHPAKTAAVRLGQVAVGVTAGRMLQQAVADVLAQSGPQVPGKLKGWTPVPSQLQELPSRPEVKSLFELGQAGFDLVMQSLLMRALRGQLFVKTTVVQQAHVPDVALEDVAGIGPAKAEALEIVECLMAPARFVGLGAKCPKGLLLTGAPGCGKTLLAKAIASTASVPFISRSGADFNQRYAGAGSSLVKELFKLAREVAPAVILIDEIDYIGRRRGEEHGGGLETDRSAALTQLLAEMDGFASAEGVVVIGTTNRPDILDKALLRPGRFDRRVEVPLPDVKGRLQILKTHSHRLALEGPGGGGRRLTGPDATDGFAAIDWPGWAKRTPGFSGADLAGLVNEAAMAAARDGARGVGERHMQVAYSKQLLGVPSGRRPSKAEMELTAAHEAGHAVVNEAMRKALGVNLEGNSSFRTVAHISIVPAGGTGGVTQFAEPEESMRMPESRRVLLAELAVCMGGRAAEELENGLGEATMGARGDFDQATRLATDMVTVGGLSDTVGPRALNTGGPLSQETRRKVDVEVDKLLRKALQAARAALKKNKPLWEAVSKALLEHETLDGESFRKLVEKHHVQPAWV